MSADQLEMSLPPPDTNSILRERLADVENRIRAFGAVGNNEVCLELLRERCRLQKILRGGPLS